jgi:hypothetical protein
MSQKINLFKALPTIVVATLLVVVIIYAWTEPSQAPPLGNVPAPLNVSINAQAKEGALLIGTRIGLPTGLIVQHGNVGIGTTTPTQKLDVVGNVNVVGNVKGRGLCIGDDCREIWPSGGDGVGFYFGDGSDGDVTISGSVTLARNMYYNNLVIPAGAALYPDGYIIHVKNTLEVDGTIARNGHGGAPWWGNWNAPALPGDRPLGGSGAGGTPFPGDRRYGGNGVIGGGGGIGGYGSKCTGEGSNASGGSVQFFHSVKSPYFFVPFLFGKGGGAGGGGGGRSSACYGGGGGSGGGNILIIAKKIILNGKITANGGNGADGVKGKDCDYSGGGVPGDDSGGGGGGGGGMIVLIYDSKTGGGIISVKGGTGGENYYNCGYWYNKSSPGGDGPVILMNLTP